MKKIKKTLQSATQEEPRKKPAFERFASAATHIAGSTVSFTLACAAVILWLVTGPLFNFSDTWQLVINTGTTIITFLMVFLIQKTQNKDAIAIQIKLNELVAATASASNRIISVEDLSEEELTALNKYYSRLVDMTRKEADLRTTHSIEDAKELHDKKMGERKKTPAGNGKKKIKSV